MNGRSVMAVLGNWITCNRCKEFRQSSGVMRRPLTHDEETGVSALKSRTGESNLWAHSEMDTSVSRLPSEPGLCNFTIGPVDGQ